MTTSQILQAGAGYLVSDPRRRRAILVAVVFLIGLVGFAAASALGGAAQNAAMLFAARGLQGVFAALLAPAALSLIAVTFVEPSERTKTFGVYGAVAGAGGALGLILGGVLTEYGSWRWCLLVNVPIAVAAVLAAVPTVRESRSDGDRRYDVPGAVLATGALVALVAGFTQAAREGAGWLAGPTLGLLGLGLVLLVAFVVTEARTAAPLLPLRVVLDRNRGGALLGSLLLAAGMFAMFLFLAYYFQVNLDYTPGGPAWRSCRSAPGSSSPPPPRPRCCPASAPNHCWWSAWEWERRACAGWARWTPRRPGPAPSCRPGS